MGTIFTERLQQSPCFLFNNQDLLKTLTTIEGPLYTRSQGLQILGPTLGCIFGLQIGPKGCTLASQIEWYPFSSLMGQYKAIKFSIY
jgi:hypothetical protein